MTDSSQKTPWHLWVIGIASLLWNAIGANDYVMTQSRNMQYLQSSADQMNVPVEVILDYYGNFPVWVDVMWAVGVWGAVAGSLLLLFRSRYAQHAWLVSIVGLIGTTLYMLAADMPEALSTPFTWVFTAVIWIVILLCIWYARRMTAAGVLR